MALRLMVVALLAVMPAPLWGHEGDCPSAASKSAIERLRENPNDVEALNALIGVNFSWINHLVGTQPMEALTRLDELQTDVDQLKPTTDEAREVLKRIKSTIVFYRELANIEQTPLSELDKDLHNRPDDVHALRRFYQKVNGDLRSLADSDPERAAEVLEQMKSRLQQAAQAATKKDAKELAEQLARSFYTEDWIKRQVEANKRLSVMDGKDAAPLKVEAWVNGEPLTDDDLKGKVVLLDFWAMWCGPCIDTFPHLRAWNEKYADKGLVIIGLTSYYNMRWDDEKKYAVRVEANDKVPAAEEHETLKSFAAHHGLTHRFAIGSGRKLGEYYRVAGIPHVVVIDQQGKVRLMRAGNTAANAKSIEAMLEKLLAGK